MKKSSAIIERKGLTFIYFPAPSSAGLEIFYTTRIGGESIGPYHSLNLAADTGDDEDKVSANQAKVLAALGLKGVLLPRQIHGTGILEVASPSRGFEFAEEGDALVSRLPGSALGVLTADCLAVAIYSLRQRIAAAVHVGWRGLTGRLISRVVDFMSRRFGLSATEMGAYLGPSIGPCCYEIGADLADRISGISGSELIIGGKNGKRHLDLPMAAGKELIQTGLRSDNVFYSALCTACNDKLFFSYRRDGGLTGRAAGIVVMKER